MHFCTYFHDFARDPERKIGLYFRGIYQCRSWVGTIPYVTTDLGVSYVRIVPIQSSTTGRCLLGGGIFPKTRLCDSVGPPEQGVEEGASVAPLVLAVCSIFILLGEASESGK